MGEINIVSILLACTVVGGLGAAAALLLSFLSKKFAVEDDSRPAEVEALLPGANCGCCGRANCAQMARALIQGKKALKSCTIVSKENADKIAQLLNIETVAKSQKKSAVVLCHGGKLASRRFTYAGLKDCVAAAQVSGGDLSCVYGCLGYGTCVKACPFGAISVKEGVAVVDKNACTACGACLKSCPRGIIAMLPDKMDIRVLCSSKERGDYLRTVCEIGCLGCGRCEKMCQNDAITISNNIAVIDYQKCTSCGQCAEECPRGLITSLEASSQK